MCSVFWFFLGGGGGGVCLVVLGMGPGPPVLGKHSAVECYLVWAPESYLIGLCLASVMCLLTCISLYSLYVKGDRTPYRSTLVGLCLLSGEKGGLALEAACQFRHRTSASSWDSPFPLSSTALRYDAYWGKRCVTLLIAQACMAHRLYPLTVEGNVEVWDEPLSSFQGSGGKWLLLSVPGPQNGWNDPPALNRVPKKKKVMENPSTQWMSLLLVTCSHVEHSTLNWSFSRQSLQINACTAHCTRISSNQVTGKQWQTAAKALPCADGGLHLHPRLGDLGARGREWLRSWDLAWAELTSLLSPCAWQPRHFLHIPCPHSLSAQCT